MSDFFAFDPNFRGGATIAAADYLKTGRAQIAVGAGVGGGPQVRVFDATGQPVGGPLSSFFAFDPSQRGGVNVGGSARAGSVDGSGVPDLVVGTGPGAVGEVKVFRGNGAVLCDLTPFGSDYRGGVVVSSAYIDDDPFADVVAGMQFAGSGPAEVKVFSGATGLPLRDPMGSYTPFPGHHGLSVAATNDPIMPYMMNIASEFGPAGKGQSVAFRVTMAPQAGYPAPTQTVTFYDAVGGYLLGSASLATGPDGNAYTGIVTTTLTLSPNGEGVRAVYSGDGVYMGGMSATNYVSLSTPLLPEPCDCGRQTAEGAGVTVGPGGTKTAGGVRTDGSIRVNRTDLTGQTGDVPAGQQWSWGTISTGADGLAGAGAVTGIGLSLYQVMPGGGSSGNGACLALLDGGNPAVFLDKYYTNWANPETPTFHARYGKPYTITEDATNHLVTVQDGVGNTFVFWDFSSGNVSAGLAGRFKSKTGPGGTQTAVTSYNASGGPTEIQTTVGTGPTAVTESFLTAYNASGLATTVTQRRSVGGGAWTTVRQAAYTYYDGTTGNGTANTLRTAVVQDPSGTALDTSYDRYYTTGTGSTGKIKYAFGPTAYARLTAALGTAVDSLTDAQIAPYADTYLEYDSSGRVTKRVAAGEGCSACSGGQGTYTYTYTTTTPDSSVQNVWVNKTVETQPDGNTNTYYSDGVNNLLLKMYTDTTTTQKWLWHYRYDAYDRLILQAQPSAVTGFSESYPDLVNSGGSPTYLSASSGLITTSTYATTSTGGDVVGFLKETDIQQGTGGAVVPQETRTYTASPPVPNVPPTYVLATSTRFRNSDGTGGQATTTSYTWQGTTAQPASITTTLPTVTAAQNGPGTATTTTTVFDPFGRPTWRKDAAGFISYTAYDASTGAVVKTIADVNTSATGDFTGLPSGWTTPAGGGLELITAYQVDGLGRTTKVTDPAGNVTYTVYLDPQYETLTYPGWNAATGRPTGPTVVTREDRANNYTESFTMTAAPHTTGVVPDGTEAVSGLQSLTRSYRNAAGQTVTKSDYFNLGGLTYTTGAMGAIGTNYYQTQYAFDTNGRPNKVVSPQGTITRTVSDGQGRKVSEWVGTNDTPASGSWSPTNNTSPSNMVDIRDYQYDGGGVGDSTLTKVTAHPGGGAADRVTQTWYDWRDRAVATKDGVSATETDGVHRPLVATTYDNRGEATQSQRYDGDGVTPSIVGGVLSLPAGTAAALRAQQATSFDELGRVYQTQVYSVNPSTGAVSTTALTTNTYYDVRGNPIAMSAPGGVWAKTAYDGAGRATARYTTDGAGGTTWSAAGSVGSDTVLTQVETAYDAAGNATQMTTRNRFDTATGAGALGTPTSGVPARVSYAATYYDAATRVTATVDVGTNGGTAWTRPDTVPAASATVLVTSYAYAADAVQVVTLTGSPTGGTFTLTFGGQTTGGIGYNATPAAVQSALQALSTVGAGNAVVTGGVGGGWQVRFAGSLAGAFQAALTGSGAGLTGGTTPSVAVSVVSAGGDAGRVQAVTDPLGLVGRAYYDALGRKVQTVENFTDGGITTSSNKTTVYAYNGVGLTSLTAAQAGGGVQTTAYVYGVTTAGGSGITSNDVVGITQWPDKTTGAASSAQQDIVTVNALGQTLTSTDRNGSAHTLTYDVLGRVTSDAVTTLGAGVDGAIRRIDTAYDGQGNAYLVTSYNAASGGTVVNQVQQAYNGLGQLTAEYQAVGGAVNTSTSPKVQYAYAEMAGGANHSRLTIVTYPDGYAVNSNYAAGLDNTISRLTSLSDFTGTVESYKYLGLSTVVERTHPANGVNLTYISPTGATADAGDKYVGLDRFGRVVDQNWYKPATSTSIADLQYGYDADGNVLWRNDAVNTTFGELYTYDGLNQLASFARGTLNGTRTGISGTASRTQSWGYDALGNWTGFTTNGSTQTRSANARNQYTAVSGATTPTYDANGNTTTDQAGLLHVYDAWNRLVTVKNAGGVTQETLSYDGLNRQVTKTIGGTTTNMLYSTKVQVVEEQVGTGYTQRYVWSPVYVNAMVERDADTSGTGLTTTGTSYQRLWPAIDTNWDVVALVNSSGVAVERYVYDPFGLAIVMNGSWSAISGSAYSWLYLYQGGWLDGSRGVMPSVGGRKIRHQAGGRRKTRWGFLQVI